MVRCKFCRYAVHDGEATYCHGAPPTANNETRSTFPLVGPDLPFSYCAAGKFSVLKWFRTLLNGR